jgi:hypothetical protein
MLAFQLAKATRQNYNLRWSRRNPARGETAGADIGFRTWSSGVDMGLFGGWFGNICGLVSSTILFGFRLRPCYPTH